MNRNPQVNSDDDNDNNNNNNNNNDKNKKRYQKMPLEVSVELRIMHQKFGVKLKELLKQYPQYPKTSIYGHSLKLLGELKEDKRKFGKGRPRKLTEQDERSVIQSLVSLRENIGTFSSRHIQNDCGLQHEVSNDTIRRCLKKHKYGYFQCRKKGLLTKEDLVKRLKFAKKCKQLPENIWTEGCPILMELVGFTKPTLFKLPGHAEQECGGKEVRD